jgi:hypothetical protein
MLKKYPVVAIFLSAILLGLEPRAQSLLIDVEESDKKNAAQELKVEFPKQAPQKKDLFAFTPSANSKTLEFFIDQKNISVAQDVVRYVVVIKSPEGSEQTLFVGIDCKRFLKFTYARFENSTWQDARDNEWRMIGNLGYNNYAAYLGRKALCLGNSANSSIPEILRRLREVTNPDVNL